MFENIFVYCKNTKLYESFYNIFGMFFDVTAKHFLITLKQLLENVSQSIKTFYFLMFHNILTLLIF